MFNCGIRVQICTDVHISILLCHPRNPLVKGGREPGGISLFLSAIHLALVLQLIQRVCNFFLSLFFCVVYEVGTHSFALHVYHAADLQNNINLYLLLEVTESTCIVASLPMLCFMLASFTGICSDCDSGRG